MWEGHAVKGNLLRAVHLLWALPIAIAAQLFAHFSARFVWCGVYGCSPSWIATDPRRVEWVIGFLALGALVAAFVLLVAPWAKSWKARLIIALFYGIAVAVASFAIIISDTTS